MIRKVSYYLKITRNDGTTQLVVLPKYIVSIDPTASISFTGSTELVTGVTEPTVSRITLTKVEQSKNAELYEFLGRSADWRMNKIEIYYSINGGSSFTKMFDGLLFLRAENLNTVTFTARGYLDLLNITLIETPVLRNRKVATYIPPHASGASNAAIFTLLQKQDPTISQGSNVGIINAVLWLIGGRPYQYKKLYDTQASQVAGQYPKFYYDCQSSVVNPEWVWFSYENLYGDLTMLCKASGGVLRQNTDGVVEYINIYNFRKSTQDFTFTDANYEELSLDEVGTEPYSRIVMGYTPRYLSGSQEVYNLVFDEYLENGQSVTRRVDFTKPVWKMVNKTISGQLTDTIVSSTLKDVKENIEAVDLFGTRRVVRARIHPHNKLYINKYIYSGTPGNFTKAQDTGVVSSQSTTLTITNNITSDSASLYIGKVSLFGRALEAANAENYIRELNQYPTISGFKELRVPDNPYVQDETTAKRLSYISEHLMENPRRKVSLRRVPFVSGLSIGSIVRVNSSLHTINENFEVYSITFSDNLNTMDLEMVSTSGLFLESDMYIVGSSYTDPDSKRLSF